MNKVECNVELVCHWLFIAYRTHKDINHKYNIHQNVDIAENEQLSQTWLGSIHLFVIFSMENIYSLVPHLLKVRIINTFIGGSLQEHLPLCY